ncbi:Na-translocating system protein MpsB [Neobacillus mesonae]|nr:putative inorganic carbon transporter subunit DabA [Neobacillus mesonae]MED4202505.1 Na-translocating system protein MpsB [Neobacillus mesonae]
MTTALTLTQPSHLEKDFNYLNLDMSELAVSASKVIAPLGPISTFAARHPWAGLEHQTFEQVVRKFKDTCEVELLPNEIVLLSAWNQGEIKQQYIDLGLKRWLDTQPLEMSRVAAERFCKNALRLGQQERNQIAIPELKSMAKKLSRFKYQIGEIHSVQTLSQRMAQHGNDSAVKELNNQMIKWCKLFLDKSQAAWSMPNREEGFYNVWRNLASIDPALPASLRKQIKGLPLTSEEALREALLTLEISSSDIQSYLEAHLLALPGWAGMMLWRSQQCPKDQSLLKDYLAVRISLEKILIKPYLPITEEKQDVQLEVLIAYWYHRGDMPVEAWTQLSSAEIKARLTLAYQFDRVVRERLWLEAWEKTYEDRLKEEITSNGYTENRGRTNALAQFAFCIDVRSEPFRRQLENAGPFETFGTAGFYGLPIETCTLGSTRKHDSLPVMFKPKYQIKESASTNELTKYKQRKQAVNSLGGTFKTLKYNLLASLALPEVSGPWLSLQTLGRTFVPGSTGMLMRKMKDLWQQKPSAELTLDHTHCSNSELQVGFSEKEKVNFVRQALKMMGLTEYFAPLVVICGHGSHSTNNPYASALDCGACGGASSGFNARVLASLCNLPEVRKTLAAEGIVIPKDTVFTAAEHITTLDELRWLYVPELSTAAKEAYEHVQASLPKVCEEAISERLVKLPGLGSQIKDVKREAQKIAEDWSEVRPEWGLARNAAFIIGDRKLTEECDLEGRAFLQNYHWQKDPDGALLANIIAGPATVAQWINLQYYASTVAPHYYGSGNKATQTVTSGVGVMQGNASDLMLGLPWQSVMLSDQEAYHAPLRLLLVIQAPSEYIDRVLSRNRDFRQKLKNGWIRLASIDPEGNWKSWGK